MANEEQAAGMNTSNQNPPPPDNGNGTDPQTRTEQAVYDFKMALENKKNTAASNHNVSITNRKSECTSKDKGKTLYIHTLLGYQKYQLVKLYDSDPLQQDTEEFYTDICEIQDNLKKTIDTKLSDNVKLLKDVQAKVKKVNEAFCKLENEINDNCNSKQRQILEDKVEYLDGNSCTFPDPTQDPNDERSVFEAWIEAICDNVKMLQEKTNDLSDKSVQLASINALLDLASLKNVSNELKTNSKILKEDVNENNSFMDKELKAIIEELSKAQIKLSTAVYDERHKCVEEKAVTSLLQAIESNSLTNNWDEEGSFIFNSLMNMQDCEDIYIC